MPHKPKRSYSSKREAIQATLRASRRTGLGLRVYWCRECKAYHMTKEKRW